MKKRIYTSVAIVLTLALLFVLKIYVSDYFFDVFFGICAAFAAFEMSKLLSKIGKYNFLYVATAAPALLFAGNLIGVSALQKTGDLFWVLYTILIDLVIMVLLAVGMYLYAVLHRKKTMNEISVRGLKNISLFKFSLNKALNTAITFVYPAFLFLFFVLLNHFDIMPLSKLSQIGLGASGAGAGAAGSTATSAVGQVSIFVLISAVLIPMITDTFAMLTGMLIGGKKLCPRLSPGKTISGAVGGVLWCVLVGACVYLVFGCIPSFEAFLEVFPIWAYLLIVLFGSCVAQASDLFESFLKRRAGVKDSGKIFPGHGGMMDRIDSYIFMAPYILLAFWIFLV